MSSRSGDLIPVEPDRNAKGRARPDGTERPRWPRPRLVHMPSEPSGSKRSPAGRCAQVAGAILAEQASSGTVTEHHDNALNSTTPRDAAGTNCPVSPDLACRHVADLRRARLAETGIGAACYHRAICPNIRYNEICLLSARDEWGNGPDHVRQRMSWTRSSETSKRAAAPGGPDCVRHARGLVQFK